MHDAGQQLWLQVPVGEERQAYDIETLADYVDFFVASLHDQVAEDDPPGPVAAQNWYESWLAAVASYGDPDQWVIGIANYGYDWPANPAPPAARGGAGRTRSPSPTP